jgi:hypothetical protein
VLRDVWIITYEFDAIHFPPYRPNFCLNSWAIRTKIELSDEKWLYLKLTTYYSHVPYYLKNQKNLGILIPVGNSCL